MVDLHMDDEKKLESQETKDEKSDRTETAGESQPAAPKGDLERFYEQFRNVPLKYVDAFIIFCFVLLIAIIAFGVLRARL